MVAQSSIAQHLVEEDAEDGEGRLRTLSECTGAEVDLAIFTADPRTAHKVGGDTDEPRIGVRVGRAGLAAHVERAVPEPLAGILLCTEALGRTTGIGHSGSKERLHVEGLLGRHHGVGFAAAFVDHLAIGIDNLRDEGGLDVFARVGHGGISAHHLHHRGIAGAEHEGGSVFKARLHPHVLCRADDIVDAHFLSEFDGNRVDALGKSRTQRDVGTRETTVGVVWPPHGGLAVLVHHVHLDIFVFQAGIGGQPSLLDGGGVGKEFEGRSGLVGGAHVVVLPRVEIHVAHIGTDIAVLRFDGHETGVHVVEHIAQGVDGSHLSLNRAVVGEKAHLVGRVEHAPHLGRIVRIAGREHLVGIGLPHLLLHKVGERLVALAHPWVLASPVAVEVALHHAHLLAHGLLGILLHAAVESSVNLQSVAIGVEFGRDGLHLLGHGLAEIEGLPVVGTLHAEFQLDGVAAPEGVFRMEFGVVGRGGFEQSHEHGRLFRFEGGGSGLEVGLGGRLDAVGVRSEVHGVGIHGEDFLLRTEEFQLRGDDHLLALHDEDFHAGDVAEQSGGILCANAKHVFHQLLRDGRSSAGMPLSCILHGSEDTEEVHTVVAVEAFVFGRNEGVDKGRCDGVVGHGRAVFVEKLAQQFAVVTVNLRGSRILGVHDAAQRGRLAEEPEQIDLHGETIEHEEGHEGGRADSGLLPPRGLTIEAFVPAPEARHLPAAPSEGAEKLAPEAAILSIHLEKISVLVDAKVRQSPDPAK